MNLTLKHPLQPNAIHLPLLRRECLTLIRTALASLYNIHDYSSFSYAQSIKSKAMAKYSYSLVILLSISCLAQLLQTSLAAGYYYTPSATKMNVIDSCWRLDPNWAKNRQALANCGIGFGNDATGGKYGAIYVVTDSSDDPVNPRRGTLRYGAIQTKPLWIVFARSMVIKLKNELMVTSFKTIDGRGAKVEIAYGPCITIQDVSHVIIHGISIHDCKVGHAGLVRSSLTHVGKRGGSDGDSIAIFGSSHVWIDHCYLARAVDGLIDVIHASTAVTISNNYFTQHDKVRKLSHSVFQFLIIRDLLLSLPRYR